MQVQLGQTQLTLLQGDITTQQVDAIVNAANSALSGGGGVDGAIHRAAGSELVKASRAWGRCPTGEARLTAGFNLPAQDVIHAVGPVYYMNPKAPDLLAQVHTYSLNLAAENNLRTLAFPAISTGAYGYPLRKAAPIALQAVHDYIEAHPNAFDEIRFVLFTDKALVAFTSALQQLMTK